MAIFEIEFERGELPGPQYDSYIVGQATMCNDDGQPRNIKFDDIVTGDFVVGRNWSNPSYGLPVGAIRFDQFTDVTERTETATGIVDIVPVPPNVLYDTSTGNDLTYPYIIPISQLGNIQQRINAVELYCDPNPAYTTVRTRKITYILADTASNWGDAEVATYYNSPQ